MKKALIGMATALVATEVISAIGLFALKQSPPEGFAKVYETYLARQEQVLGARSLKLLPHPYFGFQQDKSRFDWVNNHGFVSDVDYPYAKAEDEFVIGILGGSLAESFAVRARNHGYFNALAEKVPSLRGKRIKVLNLSMKGAKQPQQFSIAAYFAKSVDLMLNLDGYNDLQIFDSRYPAEFPDKFHLMYGAGAPNLGEKILIAASERIQSAAARFPLAVSPLRYSAGYHVFFRTLTRISEDTIDGLATRLTAREETRRPYLSAPTANSSRVEELADLWVRYAELQLAIARQEGKPVLFFLQPNQYVAPAKPFTPEETANALSNRLLSSPDLGLQARYDLLRDRIRGREALKPWFFDLTDVFASTTPTVYIDDCCHINETGEALLAERIVSVLVQKLARSAG